MAADFRRRAGMSLMQTGLGALEEATRNIDPARLALDDGQIDAAIQVDKPLGSLMPGPSEVLIRRALAGLPRRHPARSAAGGIAYALELLSGHPKNLAAPIACDGANRSPAAP